MDCTMENFKPDQSAAIQDVGDVASGERRHRYKWYANQGECSGLWTLITRLSNFGGLILELRASGLTQRWWLCRCVWYFNR